MTYTLHPTRITKAERADMARDLATKRDKKRTAFLAKHGGLLWRGMAIYGRDRFVTSVLDFWQRFGDIDPEQLDRFRQKVALLEREG